jgi:hypothetical protein
MYISWLMGESNFMNLTFDYIYTKPKTKNNINNKNTLNKKIK